MRRAKGVLLPPAKFSPVRRGQLYRLLRDALLNGTLITEAKLPSTRVAAKDYGVSRGMIEEVFAQLTEEGFLRRSIGRGTFVARGLRQPAGSKTRRTEKTPKASRRGTSLAGNAACREPSAAVPFNAGIADTSGFPWKLWHRLRSHAAREFGSRALQFADPRGLSRLREAIALHLAQFRGIGCTADQVVVFNSSQQALNTLALLLLDRTDGAWIEDPCYLGARAAFDLAGIVPTPVPVDDQGICVDIGLRRAAKAHLVYVTPPHQYPSGVALSLDRRLALLEWATGRRAWLVEDDYDGEFRYEGQPLTTLHALDSHSRVLYLGTFNKSMFVSLRLAYVIVPSQLVEPLANIRTQFDGFTPPVDQLTMSLFLEEGHFSSHLRRMRGVYAAKRAILTTGLAALASEGWHWSKNPAGMHLMLMHDDGAMVRALAKASPMDLAVLSKYRIARRSDDGLFLRFGALDVPVLRSAVEDLVSLARKQNRNNTQEVRS